MSNNFSFVSSGKIYLKKLIFKALNMWGIPSKIAFVANIFYNVCNLIRKVLRYCNFVVKCFLNATSNSHGVYLSDLTIYWQQCKAKRKSTIFFLLSSTICLVDVEKRAKTIKLICMNLHLQIFNSKIKKTN